MESARRAHSQHGGNEQGGREGFMDDDDDVGMRNDEQAC